MTESCERALMTESCERALMTESCERALMTDRPCWRALAAVVVQCVPAPADVPVPAGFPSETWAQALGAEPAGCQSHSIDQSQH